MKTALLSILLMLSSHKHAEPPNAADFALTVQVQSCHLIHQCTSVGSGNNTCGYAQHLNATINGKSVELERYVDTNMLRAGTYKARLVTDTKPRPEEYTQIYEFLFSDGKTGQFLLVGAQE